MYVPKVLYVIEDGKLLSSTPEFCNAVHRIMV